MENIKRFCWTIRNTVTGQTVGYSCRCGACDEDHVRLSPSVQAWANGDEIEVIMETFKDFDELAG
jgi:hypothetical protein